jgi:hypothetical protein
MTSTSPFEQLGCTIQNMDESAISLRLGVCDPVLVRRGHTIPVHYHKLAHPLPTIECKSPNCSRVLPVTQGGCSTATEHVPAARPRTLRVRLAYWLLTHCRRQSSVTTFRIQYFNSPCEEKSESVVSSLQRRAIPLYRRTGWSTHCTLYTGIVSIH